MRRGRRNRMRRTKGRRGGELVRVDARPGGVPDFVAIGHATRDLLPDGSWRLGGTVTFAALTAQRLGLRTAVLTSGPPDLLAALRAALPGVALACLPAPDATTYENVYAGGSRTQYLRGRAAPISARDLPAAWRDARIALLAPLAGEVEHALAAAFPRALIAATPQGWLRRWDASGRVTPGPLDDAETLLPRLRALILSREDLPVSTSSAPDISDGGSLPHDAAVQIAAWARVVPLVVVTRGPDGVLLYRDGGAPESFPGYPAREVDPTGAGDVFAAAFLCALDATADPRAAADFANRAAALSVEHPGADGIPTRADIARRFG
jgi:sugar/nucleoside kinase (ribokinase family)